MSLSYNWPPRWPIPILHASANTQHNTTQHTHDIINKKEDDERKKNPKCIMNVMGRQVLPAAAVDAAVQCSASASAITDCVAELLQNRFSQCSSM